MRTYMVIPTYWSGPNGEWKEGDAGPYIKWVFKIMNHENKKYNGQKLYHNTSLSENALFNLRSLLEAIAYDFDDEDASAWELDPEELVGNTCDVQVSHEEYEGKILQ